MTISTSVQTSRELDGLIAAFEAARRVGRLADPADFLPAPSHPLYLEVLRELVRVDLELGWDEGRPCPLEQYLARFPDLQSDATALQAVAFEEYRLRRAAGQDPAPEEYAERYRVSVAGWPRPQATSQLQDAAAAYRDFRQRHPHADPRGDSFSTSECLEAASQQLFQDLHRRDPSAAERLADGVLALPEVGTEFAGFHLLEELGRGAFGRVFLARQGELASRLVALKISPDAGGESQTLAQLQHTHIVPIHSLHTSDALQAVCMPYFGRTTLADVLRDLAGRPALPRLGSDLLSALLKSTSRLDTSPERQRHVVARSPEAVVARSPDRATTPTGGLPLLLETCGQKQWHGQETVPQRRRPGPQASPPCGVHLEGRTYVEAVLWLGRCLADGLAHAHERGILHHDLKPANVLLSDEGQPMLLDFNLAEDTKRRSSASAAMIGGTLPYMAPEHLEAFRDRAPAVDARSDIFALGIILYELLTGHPPFPNRSRPAQPLADQAPDHCPPGDQRRLDGILSEMIRDREQGPPSPRRWNRDVSPAADAIVRRCLEPDPNRRYQTARALQEDLQRQLDRLPLAHTREPSLRERARKWLHHHPRLLVKVLAVSAAVLVGVAIWLILRADRLARDQEALRSLETFREEARSVRELLGAQGDDGLQRERAIDRGRQALARYSILDDARWRDRPEVVALAPQDRERLRREAGVLLLVLAGAQARPTAVAPGVVRDDAPVRAALKLNEQAETCYADDLPPALWLQRANLLRRLGDAVAAKQYRARADGMPPRTAQDHYLLAREQVAAGRSREALLLLRTATRLEPRDFWTWFLLGNCYDDLQEDLQAVMCYNVCAALSPNDPWPYFNRGLAHLRQKDYAQANADFDRLLSLKSDMTEGYINRALARQGLKRYLEAKEDLTHALNRGASPTRVYFMRARVREYAGDKEGASNDRTEGLRRQPTDETSWVARGWARLDDDATGALADFDAALRLNPRSRSAMQNKAHVLAEKLGRTEEAIRVLDRLLELYPDFVPARAGRAVLRARLGRRDDALADAREALARDGRPATRYQVACVYALTSRVSAADGTKALQLLAEALRQGYGAGLLARDPDLDSLRALPEFARLAAAASTLQAAAAGRPSR